MNCDELEKLLDAYLDDDLAGSLRLEFHTHRLRCRRCQQTVAMMEAIGHIIASDSNTPALADDFSDQVMDRVERLQPRGKRLRATRIAVVTGVMLQAAAVLMFAIFLPAESIDRPPVPIVAEDSPAEAVTLVAREPLDVSEFYRTYIYDRVQAARANLASDLDQLARYPLQITVPHDVARASADLATVSPWSGFLHAILPGGGPEDSEQPAATPDQYSL
ncbi:MAG: hypothetical protein KKB50_11390 [Planctomycetes bacterium]|nr:hypothetical protein [Planctomycetota bacterium]